MTDIEKISEQRAELEEFLKELKKYRDVLENPESILQKEKPISTASFLSSYSEEDREKKEEQEIERRLEELREELVFKHGTFKDEIAKLTGRTDMNQFTKIWHRALNQSEIGMSKEAISLCIDYTLEAIGRLDKEENIRTLELFEEPKPNQEKETKPHANEGKKSNFQKIVGFFDYLYQVTVKNIFEGITNAVKKP